MDLVSDELFSELSSICDYIWQTPELGFKEVIAHKCLTDYIQKQGFNVTRNYILDTGFKAEFGSGHPHAVIFSEYDALPQIGHACGHNLIAIVGVCSFILTARKIKEKRIIGKVTLLGSPAEEGGGGKVIMINKGAIEDVDFAVMAHPAPFNSMIPRVLAMQSLTATFKGQSCHATQPWNGKNALDAAVLAYTNCNALRHAMKPTWRMHGIISKGGEKPNIVPSEAQLEFLVRTPLSSELKVLLGKIENCFKAAASSLECEVEISYCSAYQNLISNTTLANIFRKYFSNSGEDIIDEKANPFFVGSTDFGDVTHHVPGIHPCFSIRTDSIPHTEAFAQVSHTKEAFKLAINTSVCLFKTIIEVLSDPSVLKSVKDDFDAQIKLED